MTYVMKTDSPILEIPDINSYNLYFGWYLGDLEQNDEFFDEYHEKYPVTLFIDGTEFKTESGKTIFTFRVPITESHTITAKAADCTDSISIQKTAKENPAYTFIKRSPVTNWFDADELDPAYFSINDRLGDIRENAQAGAIINQMMAQGASERGDVADAVKDNPALQRMMGRMTLISLLKQGGADEESIKQINRVLQGIKK